MKNHGRKEPPLQDKVNHKARLKSNISYYMSMGFFIAIAAFTFASVFDEL